MWLRKFTNIANTFTIMKPQENEPRFVRILFTYAVSTIVDDGLCVGKNFGSEGKAGRLYLKVPSRNSYGETEENKEKARQDMK